MAGDYLSDEPLDDPAADRFGRRYFAERVAETISTRAGSANLVVGIYGRWGSGKTTALNFISRDLRSRENLVVESFNPWLFSSTEQLLAEFFALIAKMLQTKLNTPLEKLGGILSEFGKAASGVSVTTGLTGLDPGALLRGAGGLLAGANIRDMKKRVGRVLREKGKRVVILIDDVDRLDVEETYLLFRLVKLVADFENTTYILAFDDQVVAAALRRRYPEQERYGEGFVDKIVQVPLHLPPARLDLVHGLVFEGIDQLMEREGIVLETQDVLRFRRAFDPLAADIDTPRMAARYLNAVMFAVPGVKFEVNVVDLLLLEALRVVAPPVHQWIGQNKAFLAQPSMHIPLSDEQDRALLDRATRGLSEPQAERARGGISSLFPRARALWSPFSVGSEADESLGIAKRLASSIYFDRYFLYSVPADDVPDSQIAGLVTAAQAEDSPLPDMLKSIASGDSVGLVITKLGQQVDQLPANAIRGLIGAVAAMGENLDFGQSGVFSLSTGARAALLMRDLLRHLPEREERVALADDLVRSMEPLEFALETYRWISPSDGDADVINEEEDARLRDSIGARILPTNEAVPLFVSSPEWAARFYWLTSKSIHGGLLREQLRSQVTDSVTAAGFVRAFMTPATDLETQKRSLYLDADAFRGATNLISFERLKELLEPIAGAPASDLADRERADMTGANDAAVATRFIDVGLRLTGGPQDTETIEDDDP